MPDDRPVNRRSFFREGLRHLLRPLAQAIEPLERVTRQLDAMELRYAQPPLPPGPTTWLRPPGAQPEPQFLGLCTRCGDCITVCPAQCIKIDKTGAVANGAPCIDPDSMPCIACDGLRCMPACPTQALIPTPLAAIRMGTALWRPQSCLLSAGQPCTTCIDRCPLGFSAIRLEGASIIVLEDGCIGCGACHYACPTSPRSITITPTAARQP